jgi:hypothetical protein
MINLKFAIMKPKFPLFLLIISLQIGFIVKSNAQIDELGSFMSTGTQDAEKLMGAYVSPWINGFGASMTGGWYNTAKTHKPGGFDLTITGNIAYVPTNSKSFKIDELNLSPQLVSADGTGSESPTVAGKDESGPQMNYHSEGIADIPAFKLPKGTNIGIIPSPMAQLSIGLFKDTEITGRFFPKVNVNNDNDIFMWGVGLKHGLKQWIPAINKIPFLHLTLQGGYSRLTTNMGLDVNPEFIGLDGYNRFNIPEETWDEQNMRIQISSLTANLLISADIPFVSFYGGVGFATTKSELKMQGVYPMLAVDNSGPYVKASEKDPIGFKIKNEDGGITKPRLNVGVRFKFGFFTLHFDYTRANYNVATAGIGISFR